MMATPVISLDRETLTQLRADQTRRFVESAIATAAGYFGGEVLDYGCGTAPYRDLVLAAGASYHAFDRAAFPGSTLASDTPVPERLDEAERWDGMVCTDVLEYIESPRYALANFARVLKPGGSLVLTGPMTWPEQDDELHRFTLAGIERELRRAPLEVVLAERLAEIDLGGFQLALAWGVLARKAEA